MWGPLVLAGDLGPERRGAWTDPVPSFITASQPIPQWVQVVPGGPVRFQSAGRSIDGAERVVDLVPFYRLHRREYALYWDLYTAGAWSDKLLEIGVKAEHQKKLEAATISFVQPGDAQKEKVFNQQGEETTADRFGGRTSRRAKKWFSFDLPTDAAHPLILMVTYHPEERTKRSFEILVDGQRIGEQIIERSVPGSAAGQFFDVEYKIPAALLTGKQKVTVRFQATGGLEVGAVYGVRIVRADAPR
jgi:hypothetical protein